MSAEAQLQYESRVRNRQAVIAIVAGVLVMAASIVGLIGPHAKVNELTLGLLTDHKRGVPGPDRRPAERAVRPAG